MGINDFYTDPIDLYKLKIHEEMDDNTASPSYSIRRVPGGWIYQKHGFSNIAPVFVPYVSPSRNTRQLGDGLDFYENNIRLRQGG